MSLSQGARLGPYEILSPLGAGGVGEVFRARDTRLAREVAVRVLRESLASADHYARLGPRHCRQLGGFVAPGCRRAPVSDLFIVEGVK